MIGTAAGPGSTHQTPTQRRPVGGSHRRGAVPDGS